MLNIKITTCTSCTNLSDLLSEVDNKLLYYGRNHWNNISLMLELDYNKAAINKLLNYKRILTKRLYNPNYACSVELNQIISQVKIYLNK
jgi:hypothetical protein